MGLHASRLQHCRTLAGIVWLRHMCSNGPIQRLYLRATAHPFGHPILQRLIEGSIELPQLS